MRDFALKVLTAKPGLSHLFAVGQAGYIIKSAGGELLAIDLYLSECVERAEKSKGFKRLLPKILNPCELEFDYVVATHPHLDHFDVDSMPEILCNGRTKLFASINCRQLVQKLDMEAYGARIAYVKPGDSFEEGDFRIDFVNCDHGEGAPDAVGVVVTVDGKRIYEAGDTRLRLDRTNEIKRFGDLNILIAPINGAYGNMNEEECAELSAALSPDLTIPCHYGMFAAHGGNPGRFLKAMQDRCPGNRVELMRQGEAVTF